MAPTLVPAIMSTTIPFSSSAFQNTEMEPSPEHRHLQCARPNSNTSQMVYQTFKSIQERSPLSRLKRRVVNFEISFSEMIQFISKGGNLFALSEHPDKIDCIYANPGHAIQWY